MIKKIRNNKILTKVLKVIQYLAAIALIIDNFINLLFFIESNNSVNPLAKYILFLVTSLAIIKYFVLGDEDK